MILPKTKSGKWALGLMVFAFLAFGVFQLFMALGERGGETFFDNLKLSVTGSLMFLFGILAFFVSLYGIVRQKERAILTFISALLGFIVFVFLLGELFTSH